MRRTLPFLLLALGLLLGFLWLDQDPDAPDGVAPVPQTKTERGISPPPPRSGAPSLDRSLLEPQAETSSELQPEAMANPSASIRLELTTRAGIPGHPPQDAAGWIARLCIYPDGREAFRWIEAPFDAQGVATLPYPYLRELRRAVAIPPEGSPHGASFLIGRQLVEPEEDQVFLLDVGQGRRLHGKVADPDGNLLPGVPVQAFLDEEAPYLGYWQGSAFTTTTDATGRFHFDRLGGGVWTFAVTPEDWLMVDPLHGRQKDANGIANLEAGREESYDLGTLTVIPARHVRVTLLDNHGDPVTAAGLQVRTDGFERTDIPFEYFYRSTRKDGSADFCLPKGRWRLHITGIPGVETAGPDMAGLSFHTDDGDVTFRLPAQVGRLAGTLIDTEGAPISEAAVELRWSVGDRIYTTGTDTDALGRFDFPSVHRGHRFTLLASPMPGTGLPFRWDATVHDPEEEVTLTSPATARLRLQLVTSDSVPLSGRNLTLHLEAWNPGGGADPTWRETWRESARHVLEAIPASNGSADFTHLAPGSYVVALRRRGAELKRWTLAAGEEVHDLQVHLPR